MWETSSPSTRTRPLSGLKRPMMCFMRTVLPLPEPPRTTVVVPAAILRLMPFRTWKPANALCRSWTSMTSSSATEPSAHLLRPAQRNGGVDVVDGEDGDEAAHHGLGSGDADAARAALGLVPAVAGDHGDDEADHR